MTVLTLEAASRLDRQLFPPFERDTYPGHEFFSALQSSHLLMVAHPQRTEGQHMRHNGQRCVIGQARKHEERQVKPSHGSLCANTMSGLDKPIPFGFALFVVQRSSGFPPPRVCDGQPHADWEQVGSAPSRRACKHGQNRGSPPMTGLRTEVAQIAKNERK